MLSGAAAAAAAAAEKPRIKWPARAKASLLLAELQLAFGIHYLITATEPSASVSGIMVEKVHQRMTDS